MEAILLSIQGCLGLSGIDLLAFRTIAFSSPPVPDDTFKTTKEPCCASVISGAHKDESHGVHR